MFSSAKFHISFLSFFVLFSLSFSILAQKPFFVCGNELLPPEDEESLLPNTQCIASEAESLLLNYRPTSTTLVKKIQLKFWVMQQSVAQPLNFEDIPQDRDYLEGVIDIANNLLTDVRLPLYGGTTIGYPNDPAGTTHIIDSRIELLFDPATDLEFVVDADGWNNDGYWGNSYLSNTYVDNRDCVFDFFFIADDSISGLGRQHYNVYYGAWEDRESLGSTQPITDMQYRHAYNVIHELGHTFGLGHSWFQQFTDIQCNHCAPAGGICSATCPTPWCKPAEDPLCYSNVMSYAKESKRNLTPFQLGAMHQKMMRNNHTQYLQHEFDGTQSITISGDETWSEARLVGGNILVPTGSSLTITCKVVMPPGGRIVVEGGARLTVDGGHITRTSSRCGGLYWDGIIARGDDTQPQALGAQARVILLNDALIEYAVTAVVVDGGAVLQMTDSEIKDCRYGTYFRPYEHPFVAFYNESTFVNSTFSLTDDHTYGSQTFHELNGVSGIEFEDCSFLDLRTPTTVFPGSVANFLSRGIRSMNSRFEVYGDNLFENLWLGIEAGNSGSISTYSVEDATFKGCFGGIVNRSVNAASIRNNTFLMGSYEVTPITYDDTPEGTGDWDGFGVSVVSSLDFRLSENTFEAIPDALGGIPQTLGTFVRDLGPGDHEVRNNIFTDVTVSNYAKGMNSTVLFNPGAPGGLQYLCNDNMGTSLTDFFDFYVDNDGRIARGQGFQGQPAANTFRTGGTANGYSFRNSPLASQIRYHYYSLNLSELPQNVSGVLIFSTPSQNSCAIEDDGFSSETEQANYASSFEQARNHYLYLANGGAAQLPQAEEEAAITEAYLDYQSHGQRLLRATAAEADSSGVAEYVQLLREMGGRTKHYGVADWYREHNDFISAQAMLDSLEIDTSEAFLVDEYNDVVSLKNLHATAAAGGRKWHTLLPAEVTTLIALADTGTGIPKAQARQVLNQFYGEQYLYLPPFGSGSNLVEDAGHESTIPAPFEQNTLTTTSERSPGLAISPNPARGQVRFAFDWSDTAVRYADLVIVSSQGSVVYERRAISGATDMVWNPATSLTGVFYVYLRGPGVLKTPQKLILIK